MIGFLRGILSEITEDGVILDVNGVGYNVIMSSRDASRLGLPGSEVKVRTHLSVREDAMKLYGFLTREDLEFFRLLLTVSKIGPKVARDILGFMETDELRLAILSSDSKRLAKCPGVGAKTAQRIIIDLKDRIDATEALTASISGDISAVDSISDDSHREALEALVALGFSQTECVKALGKAGDDPDMSVEDLIKAALKYM